MRLISCKSKKISVFLQVIISFIQLILNTSGFFISLGSNSLFQAFFKFLTGTIRQTLFFGEFFCLYDFFTFIFFINKSCLIYNILHDIYVGPCTQSYGYCIGSTGIDTNLTRTIVKKHFRGKNSILKFINTNLFQTNAETVRETHKKIMSNRTRRNNTFQRYSYRLSLGHSYHDRNTTRPIFFGKHQSICTFLYLTVSQPQHL